MAIRLSETFRILEQQEKRAAAEQNDLGRGLFLKSQELLKQTNDLTEEAAIKLAAGGYEKDPGESQPANLGDNQAVPKAEAQNQT